MRAGARVHDGVLAHALQLRIVPPPSQIVAFLVVCGGREPDRPHLPVVELLEDHEGLLPVRLVVVGPVERRAPVVHRVEEQVLEDDPPFLPDHAPVVRDPGICGADRLVLDRGRGRRAPGHVAPDQERRDRAGVKQPGQQPHAGQSAGRPEDRALGTAVPARELDGVERLLHEAQVAGLTRRRIAGGDESLEGQLALGHHDLVLPGQDAAQQITPGDVAVGGHGEEQLPVREAQDRLEPPQELQVVVRRAGCRQVAARSSPGAVRSPGAVTSRPRAMSRAAARPPSRGRRSD